MVRTKKIASLEKLLVCAGNFANPSVMAAKAAGKKIVGIQYPEIPEEILIAAGCVPVLLRGTGATGTEYAEAYFRQLTCNYTRCTFDQILQGKWDFLDGAVIFNSCDHMRRIYDNWLLVPGKPKLSFLYSPKKRTPIAKGFWHLQIDAFVKEVAEKYGPVTKEGLAAAVKLTNERRRLQQEVYALQQGEAVYLTGTELLMVMLAAMSMPVEEYNSCLKALLAELKAAGETMTPKVRLLFVGGHADSAEFYQALESKRAQVVVDGMGFGTVACHALIDETKDPLQAVEDFYFDGKPFTPRHFGTAKERMAYLHELVRKYHVDGVVVARINMCDVWAMEQFMMREYLTTEDIPLTELEVNYLPDGVGQIATRMQAFVESIEARKH